MEKRTVIRSWGALTLGAVLALGTMVVLFWDVRASADITTDHVMTLAMLIVAVAAGHFFAPAIKSGNIVVALLLAVLFIFATFVCVTGSAGRGAEVAKSKENSVHSVEEKRADAKEQLRLSRLQRDELFAKWVKCSSTKTLDCGKLKGALDAQDSHVAILKVRFDDAELPQEANVRLKHAAKVFAFFTRADVRAIEYGLELVWPFALALIMELGTIVFLQLGLGEAERRRKPEPNRKEERRRPSGNGGGGGSRRRGRKNQADVVSFVEKFREKNGTTPSGSEIKNAFPGMATSTAYDYAMRARMTSGNSLRLVSGN